MNQSKLEYQICTKGGEKQRKYFNVSYTEKGIIITNNDGRIITPHNHADAHGEAPAEYSYISGNISLQTENTSTFFAHPILNKKVYREIPNINGELILFPSFMTHWTSQNLSVIPRITIAFDIITKEVYNMIDNTNYRLLTKGNI